MTVHFELDPEFSARFVHDETSLAPALEVLGRAVRDRASELYPDDPRTVGKDLHTDITVAIGDTARGVVARVNANDWKAGWYEFGSSRVQGVHALTRALEEHVGPLQPGGDDD